MPVEVTNKLSVEMQEVADCREAVRNAEADVEANKGALKLSKAALESAQEALNAAVDAAIDAERQPTLFSRFAKDDLSDPPAPAVTVPSDPPGDGGSGGGGEILDAEYTVNPPEVASLPPASGLVPVEEWRGLYVAEHFDAGPDVWEAFAAHGVQKFGELADMLLAGVTFGLGGDVVEELKQYVRDASADSEKPVTFAGETGNAAGDDGCPGPLTGESISEMGLLPIDFKNKFVADKLRGPDHTPTKLPTVVLSGRHHMVVAQGTAPDGGEYWVLRPLWVAKDFDRRHPEGTRPSDDPYLGTPVIPLGGRSKEPVFVGSKGEERKLINAAAKDVAAKKPVRKGA